MMTMMMISLANQAQVSQSQAQARLVSQVQNQASQRKICGAGRREDLWAVISHTMIK